MKIADIIVEGPAARLGAGAGRAANVAGQAVGQAAGAAKVFHSGFKQGQKKMDKLLSPSKWFGKDSADDSAAKPSGQATPDYELRRSLETAAAGRELMQRDIGFLKQLRQDVRAGKKDLGVDAQQLSLALKAVITQQALDKNQMALLKQAAQSL